MKRSFAVLALLLSLMSLGMSFGYDVLIRNDLTSTVNLELRQYHSEGFDGSRPKAWTDSLLVQKQEGPFVPGEEQNFEFSDAEGGFWVVWVARNPETGNRICEGELDFTRESEPFEIVFDEKKCDVNR